MKIFTSELNVKSATSQISLPHNQHHGLSLQEQGYLSQTFKEHLEV